MGNPAPEPETPGPASAPRAPLPSSVTLLLGLAASVVVLAGLYFASELFGPLALAAVIVIICHPLRGPLERWGWPRWAATTAVIAVAWAVLLAMALLLTFAGIEFSKLVVTYAEKLYSTTDEVIAWLATFGLDQQAASALSSIMTPSALLGFATSIGSSTLSVITALFFIFAYVIFMAADASRYRRATTQFGSSARPAMARFAHFNDSVRRYYVVNAAFGLVVAVVDGLALWAMGVPGALVWAILSFVTNFVPNIGFVLGLIPPALLALVVGGWPLMLGVIAVYCVANVVLQVLIQPKFVSDAVNLSLTLSFFSVLFWTFVIGPLGAILSIPLTLLVRALVLERDPNARWLRWLSGDSSVSERGASTPPGITG